MFCLPALLVFIGLAAAVKVPATVNIGLGPTVGALANPLSGAFEPAWGLSLQVEGHVSGKVLHSRKVMRRVPKAYKKRVREMDDAHVVPLPVMLIPDTVMFGGLGTRAVEVLPVSWSPVELYLAHHTGGLHRQVGLQLRGSWLRVKDEDAGPANGFWLGATIAPEIQSPYKQRVGFALGGRIGPGLPVVFGGAPTHKETLWLDMAAHGRLELRFPIEVKR